MRTDAVTGTPITASGRQFDDAVVILAQLQLTRRAHHALAFDAADRAFFQDLAADGNFHARPRQHDFEAAAGVGRAADHLQGLGAGLDRAAAAGDRRWDAAWLPVTWATMNAFEAATPGLSMDSTSSPTAVSFALMSSRLAVVSR